MDKSFPAFFLIHEINLYDFGVCMSICKYAPLHNTVMKKKLCETQLRLEGQSSALIFKYTQNENMHLSLSFKARQL